MKNSVVNINEKIITGICIRTNNKKANEDIKKLWNEFYSNNIISKIKNKNPNSFIYGVYNEYEDDYNSNYTLSAGIEISRKDMKNNNCTKIKKGKYILFENQGTLPQVVTSTWEEIHKYFKSRKDIKRKYSSDFEVYEEDKNIKIYISIL